LQQLAHQGERARGAQAEDERARLDKLARSVLPSLLRLVDEDLVTQLLRPQVQALQSVGMQLPLRAGELGLDVPRV
jgi:hypothetical protein